MAKTKLAVMKKQDLRSKNSEMGKNKRSGKKYYDKDSRLWLKMGAAVSLYGAVWLFVSTRVDVTIIQQTQENRNRSVTTNVIVAMNGHNSSYFEETNKNVNVNSINSQADSNNKKLFLTYQLHYDKPYNVTYGHNTRCIVGTKYNKWGRKPIRRVELSHPLRKVLNVTTTINTNLKIITVGDSVAIQFHELLEEALQPSISILNENERKNANKYHLVYQNAWGDHESVSVSAPTEGGGVLAALRMTGLLLNSGKNGKPPNEIPNGKTGAGGWLPEHIQQILNHTYYTDTITAPGKTTPTTVESFDVMLFRIPHGWLPLNLITRERIEESLILAQKLFGTKTTIIQTLFLNNNVKTMEDMIEMNNKNEMIRDLVETSWKNNSLPNLLLMDFGLFTDKLTSLNAKLAGMNHHIANYTLERLGCARFPPSIAMSCVNKVRPGSCTCTRNMISIDGMHWCMETLGGRIIAVYACLLQCSLQYINDNNNTNKIRLFRYCQKRCNNEFMSLSDASILSNITATSFAR